MLVEQNNEALAKLAAAEALYKTKQATYTKRGEENTKAESDVKEITAANAKASNDLDDVKRRVTDAERSVEDLTVALKASADRAKDFETKGEELAKLWEGQDPKEYNQKKATLNDELSQLSTKIQDLQKRVVDTEKIASDLRDTVIVARTPNKAPGVRGKVVTLNRTWNFAVLNIGSDDGLAANSTLFVYRNRQLIGKLRISSVERKLAIGDVIPESTNASIQPGDEVFQ
ncbi:hypothetical protein DB346_12320 [Verrucomicrobia bacterium LW23]|nr:hypothetical protein DB346_12320 [Verrucomicrobia bacterium LW23]